MKRSKNTDSKKFSTKKGKIIIPVLLAALLAGGVYYFYHTKKKDASSVPVQETDTVTRGNIEVTITGSASVEPYERFEIIPKVSGDIVSCPFNVGDTVKKGDLLYGFDTSNSDLAVQRQRLSLQQSKNSYDNTLKEKDKLSVEATADGIISNLSVEVGDEVKAGAKIADITDTINLEVIFPFTAAQIGSIHEGDTAVITSSKHMSSVPGFVSHISSTSYAGEDGTVLYDVTVSFENPGAFSEGMTVGGAVGENISPGSGVIKSSSSGSVYTETDGTVTQINCSDGDYVKKNAVIALLSSDTIDNKINDSTISYKNAQLSMRQTEKDLEDYRITSPIKGTVITKNSKAGDRIDKTTAQTVMMVIADISRLKFNLSIDELDVSKVSEGQTVSITCDALPDEKFYGTITTISVEGTAQNGVTTYSAEVVIDEPGNLRPSMNIDASVITESAENVLLIPTEDIKTAGKRTFVFIKDDNADAGKSGKSDKNSRFGKDGEMPAAPADGGETGNMPAGFGTDSAQRQRPDGAESGKTPPEFDKDSTQRQRPDGAEDGKTPPEFDKDSTQRQRPDGAEDGKMPPEFDKDSTQRQRPDSGSRDNAQAPQSGDFERKSNQGTPSGRGTGAMPDTGNASRGGAPAFTPQAPEGYIAVEIVTGITNEDFTEVKYGLYEGQEIYRQSTVSTNNSQRMMGGMSGGMGGMGGPPSGMGGGMSGRSGGMGGGMGGRSGGMGGGMR